MRIRTKVFGIGFHKTGTTSLARALYILGYNVTGYFRVNDPDIDKIVYDHAYRLAQRYDAVQDTPWPVLYKELDQWFPGSKFILTVRDTDSWIRSVTKHFKGHRIPAHQWIYQVNTAVGNESVYIQRFHKHNQDVIEYFQNRPDDLLVMNISEGDGWEKLCPFLGLDQPPFDFPAANTAAENSQNLIQRGRRYLSRKIDPDYQPSMEEEGISAFLRDIVHFHFSRFEDLWSAVGQLSEKQYYYSDPGQENSIFKILLSQVAEEHNMYQLLSEGSAFLDPATMVTEFSAREDLLKLWRETCFFLRQHVASQLDTDFFARLPDRQEAVREVYLHLMDFGTRQSAELRRRLRDFGFYIEEPTVMDFFYDEIKYHHPNS